MRADIEQDQTIDLTKDDETSVFAGVSTAKEQTLKTALRSIPRTCLERPTRKGVAVVARAVVLWALSLFALSVTDNPVAIFFGWIFASLALAGMFVVGHDAAHGSLFNSKRANRIVGRLLFLPELHSYEGWLLGHNRLHHGHTVRQQMDFVWHPSTKEEYENMSAYRKFQHRVEWGAFGSGLYYIRNVWWNKMIVFDPPERYKAKIKRDVKLVLAFGLISIAALFAIGLGVYGSVIGGIWLPFKLVAVPWFGFMSIIGWTVYVHHIEPNIDWWPRKDWNSFKGQIDGTTILHINPVVNWLFFYNIFIHVPHHVDMRIPCYNLVEAGRALAQTFPDDIKEKKFKWRDYFKAVTQCKVYDFETEKWSKYS